MTGPLRGQSGSIATQLRLLLGAVLGQPAEQRRTIAPDTVARAEAARRTASNAQAAKNLATARRLASLLRSRTTTAMRPSILAAMFRMDRGAAWRNSPSAMTCLARRGAADGLLHAPPFVASTMIGATSPDQLRIAIGSVSIGDLEKDRARCILRPL